jgi:hypothetical protein
MKVDTESLLFALKDCLQTNLNTKIAAIALEKADGLTLASVPTEAWFCQSLKWSHAAAHDIFVFFGVDDPQVEGIGPYTLEKESMFFTIVMKDTAENETYIKKLFRYRRAIKEVFEENFSKNPIGGRLIITSLAPISFGMEGMKDTFKAVGVNIEATIA